MRKIAGAREFILSGEFVKPENQRVRQKCGNFAIMGHRTEPLPEMGVHVFAFI